MNAEQLAAAVHAAAHSRAYGYFWVGITCGLVLLMAAVPFISGDRG